MRATKIEAGLRAGRRFSSQILPLRAKEMKIKSKEAGLSALSASKHLEVIRMGRIGVLFFVLLLTIALSFGQAPSAAAQAAPAASAIGHGSFPVKVSKTLDSSKLK